MQATRCDYETMTDGHHDFDGVIVGLGDTGLSCLRFLAQGGGRIAVMDSRDNPPGLAVARRDFPRVPIYTGGFQSEWLSRARDIVVSPGVSLDEPAIRAAAASGASVFGDIELFCRHARAPIVAVTGSNGKSTVATLVSEMIRRAGRSAALGGNIGTPALDLLADPPPDYYVLELSSFQLDGILTLNALAACVLNVTPDHMDRYRSFDDYVRAKLRIYQGDGAVIFNLDDPMGAVVDCDRRRCIGFTLGRPGPGQFGVIKGDDQADWLARGDRTLLRASDLRITGRHNIANVLAALAFGEALDLSLEAFCAAAREFSGLPHRCQFVARFNDVDWYNDSKGTNVGAACAAIAGLVGPRSIVLIAGGEGKGQDFTPLADAARGRVRSAILIGRDARILAAALEDVTQVCYATDMRAAVAAAGKAAAPGDAVLLSPACASFDMFRDYRDRGDAYTRAVREFSAGATIT